MKLPEYGYCLVKPARSWKVETTEQETPKVEEKNQRIFLEKFLLMLVV